jgi:arylsulfatase A-like enzyme
MSEPVHRSNVLIIQADQLRWDCLGIAGNPDVRTPNLDRLAAEAVRYSNAFCTYPVCTPSRYSLLSGLYARQHAGWSNKSTLAPGIETFPRALRRAGYTTAAVGKMHFTPTYLDVGYDRMELAEQNGAGRWDDDYHRELRAAGLAPVVDLVDQELEYRQRAPEEYWQTFGARPSDLPEEWHSTTWIGEHAVRAAADWSTTGGNLLHVSFIKPHHPFDPPMSWADTYDPDSLTIPPGWTDQVPADDLPYQPGYFRNEDLTPAALRRVMAHYYATISQVDYQIGQLLDLLRERGTYDDTLIVFTADHGEYLGFHHQLLKGGRHLYDPLVRVPLLVKFPNQTRSGEVNDTLVSQIDIAPTVLGTVGVEPAMPLHGLNLTDPGAIRQSVFAEAAHGLVCMVRTRSQKLISAGRPEHDALFDLTDDPYELTNRITDPALADTAVMLREALHEWALTDAVPPTNLDEHAPTSPAPNALGRNRTRRAETRAYFESHIRQTQP